MTAERKLAIMGGEDSFHDIAARAYFGEGNLLILRKKSFAEVVASLLEGEATDALMAVENSIAGLVSGNHQLLRESKVRVAGEVYLEIALHLCALPGISLSDIRELYSHPMAIRQCGSFLRSLDGVQVIEYTDTARSAARIRKQGLQQVAAIASRPAALRHRLTLLAEAIQDSPANYTRFLHLQAGNFSPSEKQPNSAKAMFCFQLFREKNSLTEVMAGLKELNIAVWAVQSLPNARIAWDYHYYLDVLTEGPVRWKLVTDRMNQLTRNFRILGFFPRGKVIGDQ